MNLLLFIGLQHVMLLCPSLSPRICSNSWSIESVMLSNHLILCQPLLLLPSIFLSIRAFSNEPALPIRWPEYWRFSFSNILPMNIQGCFPLGWTGLVSLQSKGVSRVFSSSTIQKHQFFSTKPFLISNFIFQLWFSRGHWTITLSVSSCTKFGILCFLRNVSVLLRFLNLLVFSW